MTNWIDPKKQLPEEGQLVVVTIVADGFRQYHTLRFSKFFDLRNRVLKYAHFPVDAWTPVDEFNVRSAKTKTTSS